MTPVERTALAALLLAVAAGCTAPMQMALSEPAVAPVRKVAASRVPVAFAPLVDQRPDFQRESAGSVGGRQVLAKDPVAWIDRSLQKLGGQRFAPGRAHDPAAWQITPVLRQLYASSLRVSKNANIVIELKIRPPAGESLSRIYRGRITSVNWWNASGEIEAAVTDALEDCLKRMAADIDQLMFPSLPDAKGLQANQNAGSPGPPGVPELR